MRIKILEYFHKLEYFLFLFFLLIKKGAGTESLPQIKLLTYLKSVPL